MMTAELASQLSAINPTRRIRHQRTRPNLSQACRKTKLCAYHLQGCCPKGVNCGFAHGEHELVSPPNLSGTKLCPMLKTGRCTRRSCKFAHNDDELRDLLAAAVEDDSLAIDGQSSMYDDSADSWSAMSPLAMSSLLGDWTLFSQGICVAASQAHPPGTWTTTAYLSDADTHSEASTRVSIGGESPVSQDSNDSDLSEVETAAASDVYAIYAPVGVEVTVQRTFLHLRSAADDAHALAHARASSCPAPRARH